MKLWCYILLHGGTRCYLFPKFSPRMFRAWNRRLRLLLMDFIALSINISYCLMSRWKPTKKYLGLRLWQQCCQRFFCLLRCDTLQCVVADGTKYHSAVFSWFKKRNSSPVLWNLRNYTPNDTASHPRRTESSSKIITSIKMDSCLAVSQPESWRSYSQSPQISR